MFYLLKASHHANELIQCKTYHLYLRLKNYNNTVGEGTKR